MKRIDIFDVQSTSDEAKQLVRVNEVSNSIVEWQAIVGRLYVRASAFRKVTKKHEAWKKAAKIRSKVNKSYEEQYHECR